MMKVKYFLFLMLSTLLASCNGQNKSEIKQPGDAILEIPERVDMGNIGGPHFKNFVDVKFKNTGTDTLYIIAALPECDCTEVQVMDQAVAPQKEGFLRAYLDASDFMYGVETEKRFCVASNNKYGKHVYVTLVGTKK